MADIHHTSDIQMGQEMADGSIYGGISYTTQTIMHIFPGTLSLRTWEEAIGLPRQLQKEDLYGAKGSTQEILSFLPKSEAYPYGTDKLSEEAKKLPLQFLQDPAQDDGGWRVPTTKEWQHIHENKAYFGFLTNFIEEHNLQNDYWWTCEQILPETPRKPEHGPFAHYVGFGQGMITEANLFDLVTGEDDLAHKTDKHSVLYVRTEPRIATP